jgi:flagellin
MSVINTNIKALYTQTALKSSGRDSAAAMEQLSTGKRINSAKDDAAGMAIADRMTQQIRSLNQAVRNAGDAISLIQTAEGATNEITDMLQRMRELSIQAINDTNSGDQRGYLDLEFQQLKQEIVRISDTTEWNGFPLLDGTNGVAQGEQPVYKVQATPDTFTVPTGVTTDRTILQPIEQQVLTFTNAASSTDTITFTAAIANAGNITITPTVGTAVTVAVLANDTVAQIGAKVALGMNGDATFAAAGRLAVDNGDGTVDVVYAAADAAVTALAVTQTATYAGAVAPTVAAIPANSTITVGGENVVVPVASTKVQIAALATTALVGGVFTTANPGRLVVDNLDGTLTVTYNRTDADVADTAFTASTSGAAMAVATQAVASTTTTFANTGGFEKSGELKFSVVPETNEVQKIVFGPATGAGTGVVVGGVTVAVATDDTAVQVAAKVQAGLMGDVRFATNPSGRTITNNLDGSLSINYAGKDADVVPVTFAAGGTGVTGSVSTTTNYGGVTATYDVDDGDTVTLSGSVDASNGTVTFAKASVAQVDTFTLAGTLAATDILSLSVGNLTYDFTAGSIVTADVASGFVNGINANRELKDTVLAKVERDGTITLTAKVPGVALDAHATIARTNGANATISSTTTTANVTAGDNAIVISDDMTVTMLDAGGLSANISHRAPGITVDVKRTFTPLPVLAAGDLIINGISVGPSLATGDTISSSNNAGSAIAKAAVINSVSATTGVQAVVSEAVLTGTAMVSGAALTGTVTINGFTSPTFTTTLNNSRETRSTVVEALNRMTPRTGVIATDTGSDAKGIRLEAADGRNIEVFFNSVDSNSTFALRTGLREGLTTGSIALESKVEAPVVLTTSGDITKAGLVAGDYSANKTTVANSDRAIALAPKAQVSSVDITGTIGVGDSFSITINGRTKTFTSAGTTGKPVIDARMTAIENDSSMSAAVTVNKGSKASEIYLTSKVPGIEFTVTASTTATAGFTDVATVTANADATNVKLNSGDLVLNGIAVPGATTAGDTRSVSGILSGQQDSSGIAIAAAINSVTDKTGVTAAVKPASIAGTTTVTGAPGVFPETGIQSLYINGIEVEVNLTEDEPLDTRRENILAAINRKLDSHGVQATNNTQGVTLTASDGRNVSVWFDSSVPGLSPSSFGLSSGDEVAQISTVTVTAPGAAVVKTATIEINGVTITTANTDATPTASELADALKLAIDTAMNNNSLSNLTVTSLNGVLTVASTIPGSGFTIQGVDSASVGDVEMTIATPTANSLGTSAVTGIWNGTGTSDGALTMYSGVELTSNKEFTVASGTNGYTNPAHWKSLGFTEGTFGGKSSVEMSPPRVGRMTFQVGATVNQSINVDFADFGKDGPITGDITSDVALWDKETRVNRIDNRESATAVLTKLDAVLDKVNGTRATMGAVMNRLEHVIDNLMNVSVNTEASRSQIEDADYAAASTELARTQIMQQAATAILAQANADQQGVLKLLQ